MGQGAAAVVSAGLGIVSLTGSWVGTVAAARAGDHRPAGDAGRAHASVATQLEAVYGDAWQTTALWGGIFALAALLVGVVVLARPAFGDPDQAAGRLDQVGRLGGRRARRPRPAAGRPQVLRRPARRALRRLRRHRSVMRGQARS